MKRFGLPARWWRSRAAANVRLVSWASKGETSSDTQPSTAVGPGEDRLKQIGGPRQIRQGQVEEQILGRLRAGRALGNVAVVVAAVLDRIIEDCRIRGQPGHRKFVDVALERAAIHQVAGDIVEPEALTEVVECLRWFHRVDC